MMRYAAQLGTIYCTRYSIFCCNLLWRTVIGLKCGRTDEPTARRQLLVIAMNKLCRLSRRTCPRPTQQSGVSAIASPQGVHTNMFSASNAIADSRWTLKLRSVGQQIRASFDTLSNGVTSDGPTAGIVHKTTSTAPQDESDVRLPLSKVPADICLNILTFLSASGLCAVRRASWDLLQTAHRHEEQLWENLCKADFPSVSQEATECPSPQRYVMNVIARAKDELANLRSTRVVRESLQAYAATTASATGSCGGGIVGLACDLGSISDPRIARAVSHKRRAALWSVVVTEEYVVEEFRRRGLHRGPLNFLPLTTLQLENPALSTAAAGGAGGCGGREASALLPQAPEDPAPAGFVGYVVRLMRLRPEHECLRWTVLYALYKDMAVFDTTAEAEAVRMRSPNQRLFYCSLDHPGPGGNEGRALPHISHWGNRPLFLDNGGGGRGGHWGQGGDETVAHAVERLETTACFAETSLAFLRYGDGISR